MRIPMPGEWSGTCVRATMPSGRGVLRPRRRCCLVGVSRRGSLLRTGMAQRMREGMRSGDCARRRGMLDAWRRRLGERVRTSGRRESISREGDGMENEETSTVSPHGAGNKTDIGTLQTSHVDPGLRKAQEPSLTVLFLRKNRPDLLPRRYSIRNQAPWFPRFLRRLHARLPTILLYVLSLSSLTHD
jgi:hypothetical protein